MTSSVILSGNSDDTSGEGEIPSLLVPIAGTKLVLPTVSVAEMIPYKAPEGFETLASETSPEWYLGTLYWRGKKVPMISYELINGLSAPDILPSSQVLILNGTGVNRHLPFLCMPTQGIPRLSRVAADEIFENSQVQLKPYEQMHVHIAGEVAIIPDVTKLENSCVEIFAYPD